MGLFTFSKFKIVKSGYFCCPWSADCGWMCPVYDFVVKNVEIGFKVFVGIDLVLVEEFKGIFSPTRACWAGLGLVKSYDQPLI